MITELLNWILTLLIFEALASDAVLQMKIKEKN